MGRVVQPTVFEVMVRRGGFIRAYQVMAFFVAWGVAEAELGPGMKIEDYVKWWGISTAKAYRDWKRWRDVVPEFSTPGDLIEALGTRDVSVPAPEWFVSGGASAT